jgi:hypothetical protein
MTETELVEEIKKLASDLRRRSTDVGTLPPRELPEEPPGHA